MDITDERNNGEVRCYIPKRYILTALSFTGVFCIYAMRVNLSIAIVAMVNSTEEAYSKSNTTNFGVTCPNFVSETQDTQTRKIIGPRYNWNALKQGQILGAFYYGNVVTQLPAGLLSEKIGAKWLFGGCVLSAAFFNLLTPFIASFGATALIIMKIIDGLGQGAVFPAVNVLISQWCPKTERSRLSSIIFTGAEIGLVLSMPISGWLSGIDLFGGWPSVFYLFGTISCMWFLLWSVLIYETPATHPTISMKELQYYQENSDKPIQKPETPWKEIFSSLPMWAVLVSHVGDDLGDMLFRSDLPTYLSTVLHFNINDVGLLSALPFVFQAISAWIASYIADKLRISNTLSITSIRKIFNSIGLIGPSICLLIITMSGCRPYLIVFLITLCMTLNGFVFSGFNVTHVDMSPSFAGTLYAITNTVASCMGFVGPTIVGVLTDKGVTVESWNNIFYITAGIYVIIAAFFAVFASAEPQLWGTGKSVSELQLSDTMK